VWRSPERGGYAVWEGALGWGEASLLARLGSEVRLVSVRLG
jgi:hypothetical protein